MPPLSPELIKILCCPETHQEIHFADSSLVAQANQRIAAGTLHNRAGDKVSEAIEGGFVRSDGQFLYPIRKGIPVMLIGEAIPVDQIAERR